MKNSHYILYEGICEDWYKKFKTKSEAMSFIMIMRNYLYFYRKEYKIKYYNKLPTSNRQLVVFPDDMFNSILKSSIHSLEK